MTDTHFAPAAGIVPKFAIFTDFDGTLVDIAETPDSVDVPAALPHQIERAANELDSAFAVITGRQIIDIDKYLAPLVLPVAGAHGSQRRKADGSLETLPPEIISGADLLAENLEPLLAANPDLIVERKDGAVALHYRQAPELERACQIAMEEAAYADDRFELVPGKMVIEARPRGLSKGTALRAFMQEAPFAGRTPIFIGDDTTDEDAFVAAQDLGGIGIKLGAGRTAARMRIANVASVHALIQGLGDIAARDRSETTH
jgi:trehalose 6-phosphate phosphatase